MDLKFIGSTIKQARKIKGLTQEQLAELIGIHEKQLSKIETGKSFPTRKNLEKIFSILNINITEDNIQSELPKNASKEYFAIMKIINNSTEKELSIYLNILKVLKENL